MEWCHVLITEAILKLKALIVPNCCGNIGLNFKKKTFHAHRTGSMAISPECKRQREPPRSDCFNIIMKVTKGKKILMKEEPINSEKKKDGWW